MLGHDVPFLQNVDDFIDFLGFRGGVTFSFAGLGLFLFFLDAFGGFFYGLCEEFFHYCQAVLDSKVIITVA